MGIRNKLSNRICTSEDKMDIFLYKTKILIIKAIKNICIKNFKFGLIFLAWSVSTYNYGANPIIGAYWAFAPCSSDIQNSEKISLKYESNGKVRVGDGDLYDQTTYRGEIATNLVKLFSKALHVNICVIAEPSKLAISDPKWWLLLPKPIGLFQLEKRKFPISILKQISVQPNSDGTYCSSLVVKKKSKLLSLGDLHDREIVIPSYSSTGSYLYPNSILKNYFKKYNIHYKTGIIGESKIELVKNFFKSETSNSSALMIWDNELEPYKSKYRTIMQFCGIPDYILVANNKVVSKKQINEIDKALEKYHGDHITWINPDRESFDSFFNAIKAEIKENEV